MLKKHGLLTKKIAIIGCGWFGFPLATSLIEKGYFVKGSTTSKEKKKMLSDVGISAYTVLLSEINIEGDIDAFLENTDCIIINIPPKLRGKNIENYVNKIKLLIHEIKNHTIKKVIFISSTSVYSNDKNSIITEATLQIPDTESGKQILSVEQLLQESNSFKTTIVRFGGLIGNDRHPIHFLSGRKNVKNPNAPINLIHLNDCIGIVQKIIDKDIWGESFNAVYPNHTRKEDYYTKKAKEMNLIIPEFDTSTPSKGKIINSNKVETLLDYSFTTEV